MKFKAALFDMDGTILDSMDVWAQVDIDFFAARGIVTPPDYGPALAGKTFRESAVYTKERFSLSESVDEIMTGWNSLCRVQYEQHVPLKPGALAYLRFLKRCGVKLAVATALPPDLYLPALRRNHALDLFDAFASTEETATGKSTGEVYLLAAQRLGVDPADCMVFEDILEGHIGARAAGMRSCNVYDRHADHHRDAIRAAADCCTRDFSDAPRPDVPLSRAVIVTSWPDRPPLALIEPNDFVIAVDRGCAICRRAGIRPDICLGDFDSLQPGEEIPQNAERHPAEKDDTDTALALKRAIALGYDRILLLGGLGGRLDHSIANLQLMRYAAARGVALRIVTPTDSAQLLTPGIHFMHRTPAPDRFSLLAFSPAVENLTISGAKYEVRGITLTDDFPLGISNERLPGASLKVSFDKGLLLLVQSAGD